MYEATSLHRDVIEEVKNPRLQEAYSFCRTITRSYAKTFYLATRFLPHNKQRSIFAIYALCRYLDDLVDKGKDLIQNRKINPNDIGQAIQNCRDELIQTYHGKEADNPIFLSFSDVLQTHKIPIELPLMLIEGVSMDLTKKRYDTFEELYSYCYKVASVVGLMTSEVFGYQSKDALPHAVDLGIAMQLTNVLRDIGQDLSNDRIYLPKEDLNYYNLTEDDLKTGKPDGRFIKMMKFQIERSRQYYKSADQGVSMLDRDSQLPVYLARHNYSQILNQIEQNHYQVFDRRAYLTTTQKLISLPGIWWRI